MMWQVMVDIKNDVQDEMAPEELDELGETCSQCDLSSSVLKYG